MIKFEPNYQRDHLATRSDQKVLETEKLWWRGHENRLDPFKRLAVIQSHLWYTETAEPVEMPFGGLLTRAQGSIH